MSQPATYRTECSKKALCVNVHSGREAQRTDTVPAALERRHRGSRLSSIITANRVGTPWAV